MSFTYRSLASLCFLSFIYCSHGQELNYQETSFDMHSEVLDEQRSIKVYHPKDPDENLWVLYLLDGNWNYDLVKGTLGHWVRWSLMPDVVLVSIDNMGTRTRDFTPSEDEVQFPGSGRASRFLSFLEEELKPKIIKDFPKAKAEILMGHSFGGLFALYGLKEGHGMFDGYIAASPSLWWKDRYMYGSYDVDSMKRPFVYITAGTNDRGNTQAATDYTQWLMEENYEEMMELHSDIHQGEDHFSNFSMTMNHALKKLFPAEMWGKEAVTILEQFGLDSLKRQSNRWREDFGFRYQIPIDALLSKSYQLATSQELNKGVSTLRWLLAEDPEDYRIAYYLASIYEPLSIRHSIDYYEKSLDTGDLPERTRIVITRKLSELQSKASSKVVELSTNKVETSLAFTPDFRTAFVSRHNGQWGKRENPPSKIYEFRLVNDSWREVGIAPFSDANTDHSDGDVFVSYDGTEAYFTSTRPYASKADSNPDIWKSILTSSGKWSMPQPVTSINSPGYEASPVTDNEGNLYFSSIRSEGVGMGDIYVATKKEDGSYESPALLQGAINSESGEWNLMVSPDASWILFEASGKKDGLSPYGDLYLSKNDGGTWSEPTPVPEINTTGSDLNIRLSPDKKRFFYISSEYLQSETTDIYSIDLNKVIQK